MNWEFHCSSNDNILKEIHSAKSYIKLIFIFLQYEPQKLRLSHTVIFA